MTDDKVEGFLESFGKHCEYLKGLHLDLSNTKVTSDIIPKLISTIKSSDKIISLGMDFGDLPQLSEASINPLISQIGATENQFVSLALGFHDSKVITGS